MSEEYINYNELEDMEYLCKLLEQRDEDIKDLKQENKQLKEELENDIDRYEDTISYQLGFDKGKEYLQQRIDKAIEYIKNWRLYDVDDNCINEILLEILGDKEK